MKETSLNPLQQQVATLLEWDELQYCNYVFESGIEYLRWYLPNENADIITCILRSKSYWAWWKRNWQARDESYLSGFMAPQRLHVRRDIYTNLHSPRILATEIRPSGIDLKESYAAMIGEFNDEQKKVSV